MLIEILTLLLQIYKVPYGNNILWYHTVLIEILTLLLQIFTVPVWFHMVLKAMKKQGLHFCTVTYSSYFRMSTFETCFIYFGTSAD